MRTLSFHAWLGAVAALMLAATAASAQRVSDDPCRECEPPPPPPHEDPPRDPISRETVLGAPADEAAAPSDMPGVFQGLSCMLEIAQVEFGGMFGGGGVQVGQSYNIVLSNAGPTIPGEAMVHWAALYSFFIPVLEGAFQLGTPLPQGTSRSIPFGTIAMNTDGYESWQPQTAEQLANVMQANQGPVGCSAQVTLGVRAE